MSDRSISRTLRNWCAAMVILLAAHGAWPQLASNSATVTLTATLTESLTVAALPTAVTFPLVLSGVATGNVPVVITTTWILGAGRANLVLDAYFASALTALTAAGPPAAYIPTANILGQDLTGTPVTFTAFTQLTALGPSGAGLTLFTLPLTALNRTGVRADTLSLEINTTGLPQLPAGGYTGTMTIEAQAL